MNLQFDNFRKETKPFLKKNSNDRITEKSPTFKLKIDWHKEGSIKQKY